MSDSTKPNGLEEPLRVYTASESLLANRADFLAALASRDARIAELEAALKGKE